MTCNHASAGGHTQRRWEKWPQLIGGGGFAANGQVGPSGPRAQRTPVVGADPAAQTGASGANGPRAQRTPLAGADPGAQPDGTAAAAPQGGARRAGGQGFAGIRLSQQLMLMSMHVMAFLISIVLLPMALKPGEKRASVA